MFAKLQRSLVIKCWLPLCYTVALSFSLGTLDASILAISSENILFYNHSRDFVACIAHFGVKTLICSPFSIINAFDWTSLSSMSNSFG